MTSPSGPPSASASALSADGRARLATALEIEHQAVYGYGVLGPYLSGGNVATARAAEAAHRSRRDRLDVLLGAGAPSSAAAYALPQPVTDRASALRLAALLEDGVTTAYRAALAATEGAQRKFALDAMLDAAGRAAAWKRAAGTKPGTVPFPGRPS
jgi:hypothetical protein